MNLIYKKLKFFLYRFFYYTIVIYQKIISPIIPARCRYYPTCSNYGKQALAWHGVRRGSWLLLKRIGRCHPLGGHGIDFVPLPLAAYNYQYLPSTKLGNAKNSGFGVYRDDKSYVSRLNYLLKTT